MEEAIAEEQTLIAVGEVVNIGEASGRLWDLISDSTLCFYYDLMIKGGLEDLVRYH